MTAIMVLMWIAIGLLTGWLAAYAVSEGGRGLVWDLSLGVAGSSVVCLVAWSFTAPADMGAIKMAVAGLSGAVGGIIAQRNVWSAPVVVRRRVRAVAESRR